MGRLSEWDYSNLASGNRAAQVDTKLLQRVEQVEDLDRARWLEAKIRVVSDNWTWRRRGPQNRTHGIRHSIHLFRLGCVPPYSRN